MSPYIENNENNNSYNYSTSSNKINLIENKAKNEAINSPKVYPNPTNGNFTVDLGETNTVSNIIVTNSIGVIIYKKGSNNKTLIDISNFPKGIYIVKIYSGKNVFIEKMVYQ